MNGAGAHGHGTGQTMEANRAVVCRFVTEILGSGKLAAIDDLVASDFALYHPAITAVVRGRAGLRTVIEGYRAAFPDLEVTIEEQIAEGDKVVTRFTARGMQSGALHGLPATCRQVAWTGIAIYRLDQGKVAEIRLEEDLVSLLQQLGVLPEPQPAGL